MKFDHEWVTDLLPVFSAGIFAANSTVHQAGRRSVTGTMDGWPSGHLPSRTLAMPWLFLYMRGDHTHSGQVISAWMPRRHSRPGCVI
jgi:hypothetical protein